MIKYICEFCSAFIIAYCLIPLLKKLAIKINFMDVPARRKQHKEPVPLLAGVGIFMGFTVSYLIFSPILNQKSAAILIGGLLILGIGLIDDWVKTRGGEFPALPKFIVQILAAIIVYKSGIAFYGFYNYFTHKYIVLAPWMTFLLSVTWIFGVTTVINFMDGIDGLAGALTAISGITLFVVALAKGQGESAMLAIIIVGACIGYLKYNMPPAKVLMGDAGATFLGYILAIVALDGAFKQATIVSIIVPVLALGVPIFDNVFVVAKRFAEGKPVYKADSSQAHYRLIKKGLSKTQALAFLCLCSVCCSLLSIIVLLLRV